MGKGDWRDFDLPEPQGSSGQDICEPVTFTITNARRYSDIGKTRLYEYMSSGHLRFKKLGKKRLILREDLDRLIKPAA